MIFSRMKTRVRSDSGWSGESDLTTARLEEAINYIYTRVIPHILNWQGLQQWVFFDLADGIDVYDFDTYGLTASGGTVIGTRLRTLIPPLILQVDADTAAKINSTYDSDGFWNKYPPYTNEDENQPIEVLIKGRNIFPRPIPDASYVIKTWANMRPAAMTGASEEPVVDWAEAIIDGSVALLQEDDKDPEAKESWAKFTAKVQNEISNDDSKPLGRVKRNW